MEQTLQDKLEKYLYTLGYKPGSTRFLVLSTYIETALYNREHRIVKPTVITTTATTLGLKINNIIQHLFQCKKFYEERFGSLGNMTPQEFGYDLMIKFKESLME